MPIFAIRQRIFIAKCPTWAIILLIFLLSNCGKTTTPSLSNTATVQVFSGHHVMMQTYDIPETLFRGVTWPSPSKRGFTLWMFTGKTEHYVTIPVPSEVAAWQHNITDTCAIEIVQETPERIIYGVTSGDERLLAHISLPHSTKGFTFSVLTNASHDYIVVFMDISEDVVDTGVFGYVVISPHQ